MTTKVRLPMAPGTLVYFVSDDPVFADVVGTGGHYTGPISDVVQISQATEDGKVTVLNVRFDPDCWVPLAVGDTVTMTSEHGFIVFNVYNDAALSILMQHYDIPGHRAPMEVDPAGVVVSVKFTKPTPAPVPTAKPTWNPKFKVGDVFTSYAGAIERVAVIKKIEDDYEYSVLRYLSTGDKVGTRTRPESILSNLSHKGFALIPGYTVFVEIETGKFVECSHTYDKVFNAGSDGHFVVRLKTKLEVELTVPVGKIW